MAKTMLCIDGMEQDGQRVLPLTLPRENLMARGTVRTTPQGATPDSLGCVLRLLGARQSEIPAGRAAWEALALGISLGAQDVVLRCTLCAVEAECVLAPMANHADAQMLRMLGTLQGMLPVGWTLYPMSGYRGLLRIQNGAASLRMLGTVPPHQHFGESMDAVLPQGGAVGEALRVLMLESHARFPGMVLVPWGQSAPAPLFDFAERSGVRGGVVCQTEIIRGLALALGMDCPAVGGATADIDTDLAAKYAACRALQVQKRLAILHVNGCDEAAHRRNSAEKIGFLQRIDRELLTPLLHDLSAGDRLLLCSDHKTSSISGKHEEGEVSFWIYEGGYRLPSAEYREMPAAAPLRLLLGREDHCNG